MDLGLKNKLAIVCGGSRGLGLATARSLALEGAELVLVARNNEALEKAATSLSQLTRVRTLSADLTSPEGRALITSQIAAPDILVTNPGVRQVPADAFAMERAEWDQWFEAHCYSALDLIRFYVPGMAERGFGRVVNISVSFIKFPQRGFAHSHAARLALSGAIAAMAREVVGRNVTLNSVLPGLFDTDALQTNLHGHAAREGKTYEEILADRLSRCPAGRLADPSECGDLIAFLCAAQSGFITAQNIVNDGGVYEGLF